MRLLLDKVGIELDGRIIYHKEHGAVLEGFRRVVKLNTRVNYIDGDGKELCSNDYEDGRDFHLGFARVMQNGLWGFINRKGEEFCKCQFKMLRDFFCHHAVGCDENGWHLIGEDGTILNEEGYDQVWYWGNGFVKVMKDGKYGLIDRNGVLIAKCVYDRIDSTTRAILNGEPAKVEFIKTAS